MSKAPVKRRNTTCTTHPRARAAWVCRGCSKTLCPDCAVEAPVRAGPALISCLHCGNVADTLTVRRTIAPYWDALPTFVRAMFSKAGLIQLFAVAGMMYVTGLFSRGLAAFVVVSYVLHMINRAAHGAEALPEPSDFTGADSFGVMWRSTLATALIWMPAAILIATKVDWWEASANPEVMVEAALHDPRVVLLLLAGIAYYPAAIITGAVSESLLAMLNPWITVRMMLRIPGQYALTVAVWGALAVADTLLGLALDAIDERFVFPVILPMLLAAARLPLKLITAFILGRLVYQNAEDFGLLAAGADMVPEWPEAKPRAEKPVPIKVVVGKPSVAPPAPVSLPVPEPVPVPVAPSWSGAMPEHNLFELPSEAETVVDPGAHDIELGRALVAGDAPAAMAAYRVAREVGHVPRLEAWQELRLSSLLEREGLHREAAEAAERAGRTQPTARAWYTAARLFNDAGDPAKAEAARRELLTRFPADELAQRVTAAR